ncbi:MAG: hypothetical protein VX589_13000 [Myxococcota bacterium]|nr:hypothetical protein [Myxococcota bacterium]
MKQFLVHAISLSLALFVANDGRAQNADGTVSTASSQTTQRGKKRAKRKDSNASSTTPQGKAAPAPVLRRSNRMEFDGRLVKGEKADGAVYLFQKVARPLPALLRLRRHELDKIVWPVLRRGVDAPAVVPAPVKPAPKAKPENKAKTKGKTKRAKRYKRKVKKRKRWRPKKTTGKTKTGSTRKAKGK